MSEDEGTTPEQESEKADRQRRNKRGQNKGRKYDFRCIRELRQKRHMTIEAFAKMCGLSYAPISRIETNLIKPNLETLDKIAMGFSMPTHALLELAEVKELSRLKSKTLREGASFLLMFATNDLCVANGMLRRGARLASLELPPHQSKIMVVRSGRVQVRVRDEDHQVSLAESVHFDASMDHDVVALDDSELTVILRVERTTFGS